MKTTSLFLSAGAASLLVMPVFAGDHEDEVEIPFDVAEVFFELNKTDGDLGIHAMIDGEPWKRLQIEDTKERRILGVGVRGRLRRQGLTEIFFESAEPTFDELPPSVFFHRFPEGTYEVEGVSLEGDELENIARDLSAVDPKIPFTILAFFPEYQMKNFRRPQVQEMVKAYRKVKATGLQNIIGHPAGIRSIPFSLQYSSASGE